VNKNKFDVNKSLFWDTKYINNEFKWDLGKPTPIFKNWSKSIRNKNIKICIPGCGRGHDVLYLSNLGFNVYAVDFSKEAINYINRKSNKKIKTLCVDFFDLNNSYNSYFDYILEYTFYCAIDPKNRKKYVSKCYDILKNNGKIIAIMIPIGQPDSSGSPPFNVTENEVVENFSNKFKINKIYKSNLSIKPRENIELFVEYEKKYKI
tara:strand:+ start:439 stop:1056 length:618 start_codon:yes stop_codon:yes gene_type:complete